MRKILFLILLIINIVFIPQASYAGMKMTEAKACYKSNWYVRGIGFLQNIIDSSNKDQKEAYYWMGKSLYQLNSYQDAVDAFLKSGDYCKTANLECRPNADDYTKAGMYKEAIQTYLNRSYKNSTVYYNIAESYMLLGDINSSKNYLEMSGVNSYNDKLAGLYFLKGDYKNAFNYAKHYLTEVEPNCMESLNVIGLVALALNQPQTVVKAFNRTDNNLVYQLNRAYADYQTGNPERSANEYKSLLNGLSPWFKALYGFSVGNNNESLMILNNNINESTTGKLGMVLKKNNSTDDFRFIVISVEPGSPAQQAGIKLGSLIIKIDGVPVYAAPMDFLVKTLGNDVTAEQFAQKLAGAPESEIKLSIQNYPCTYRTNNFGFNKPVTEFTLKRKDLSGKEIGDYFALRSLIYRTTGEKEKAYSDYNEAIRKNPDAYLIPLLKYLYLVDSGNKQEAKILESEIANKYRVLPLSISKTFMPIMAPPILNEIYNQAKLKMNLITQ